MLEGRASVSGLQLQCLGASSTKEVSMCNALSRKSFQNCVCGELLLDLCVLGIAGGVSELPHGKGSKVVRRGVSCEMCEDTFWTGTR